jgi:hypothetical protein
MSKRPEQTSSGPGRDELLAIAPLVHAIRAAGFPTQAASSGEGSDHAFVDLDVDGPAELHRLVQLLQAINGEAEGVGLFLDVALRWRARGETSNARRRAADADRADPDDRSRAARGSDSGAAPGAGAGDRWRDGALADRSPKAVTSLGPADCRFGRTTVPEWAQSRRQKEARAGSPARGPSGQPATDPSSPPP